jgi:hypothetical protein
MNRTTVPKAAVYEHCNSLPREGDVHAGASIAAIDTILLAESIAGAMESRPKSDLGLGVAPAVSAHC